ncbi:TMEM165/GDT1 family protein [Acidimicrobium ferrooxidans]|uniref:TMEM165/GDT1 family protein n=1 Tax=Acidimicrobium ferrooxidans TaxID=53635 RepID=UPI0011800A02|nr:TMEM165/GDT1 family protein [Acidimicrobium ferrooxidans]
MATSFVGELPDKTMIAAVILGRRHHPTKVVGAAVLGLGAQAAIAVTLATVARRLLKASVVHQVSGAILLVVAAVLVWVALRAKEDAGDTITPNRPFWQLVGVFFLAELGDVTQATTAGFALSSSEPVVVAVAATAGMTLAIAIGATASSALSRIPERAIWASAAAILILLGVGELTGVLIL